MPVSIAFPEREKALNQLGSYEIIHEHDDGDLTVKSNSGLYVITTEGETFTKVNGGQTMPSAEEVMGEIREAITGLQEQQAQLTELLTYKLENPDNPSALCEAVLDETPACQDFSGVRRFAACEAWRIMEEEKVPWQEAIQRAWAQAHEVCTWGPEEEAVKPEE